MNKYDFETVFKYVNGDDIDKYEIDELENDYLFMIQVILYTNDKNMYNLCSFDVKNNFRFVKFLINKFEDDIPFINKVADYFIMNSSDDFKKIELAIMMCAIIRNKKDEYYNEYYSYKMFVNQIYKSEKTIIEIIMLQDENKVLIDEVGMGFIFISDKYSGNKIILDYFADRFIDDILFNDVNLEKRLHLSFNTFDDLNKYGINNYCIEFISLYDKFLADYLTNNLNVLAYLKKRLKLIKRNWNNYNDLLESRRFSLLIDIVNKYLIDNVCCFDINNILNHFCRQFGVLDNLKNYLESYEFNYDDKCYFLFDDYRNDSDLIDFIIDVDNPKDKMTLLDVKHYNNIKKIAYDILFSKDLDELENKYITKNNNVLIK